MEADTSRRRFLKATGAGATLAATGLAGCMGGGGGDGDTLTFGAVYILSGFASMYGEGAENGLEMAVEEINDDGGIDGREVEVITRDSEASPDTGIRQARSLVQEEDVDALIGFDSSGVAQQVAPVVGELQVPLLVTHAATPYVTTPEDQHERGVGNDYVFRASNNLAQNIHGAATMAGELDAESWTTIGPDYAFGHDTWDYFRAFSDGMGHDLEYLEDGVSFPELASDDYTPHINRVLDADPDGVITPLWGTDLITFADQAQEAGFFEQVDHTLVSVGLGTDVLSSDWQLPEGEMASTRYWFQNPDTETNNTFAETFMDEYGRPPSYNSEGAYRGMHLYKDVIESAGSADADDVIDELEGFEHSGPVGDYRINPDTHQAELPSVWGETVQDSEYDTSVIDPVHRRDAPPDELRSLLEDSDLPSGV